MLLIACETCSGCCLPLQPGELSDEPLLQAFKYCKPRFDFCVLRFELLHRLDQRHHELRISQAVVIVLIFWLVHTAEIVSKFPRRRFHLLRDETGLGNSLLVEEGLLANLLSCRVRGCLPSMGVVLVEKFLHAGCIKIVCPRPQLEYEFQPRYIFPEA